MRVELDGGQVIELGETEATPTIGISDFSRRETDDYGVTTVVRRPFARRMTSKLKVPFAEADAVQRALADLRAVPAKWVADDRFAWLSFRGFYKDFEIDLASSPTSFCTLTVEGLAETEATADLGDDPAPDDATSTLKLLQPMTIAGNVLALSSVAEDDYPEWSATTSFPVGARVIKQATHRIYESRSAGNLGNDPEGISGKWTNVGPTNRWAMFDQALGSVTTATNSISVRIAADQVNAVALLDVVGASVRVQVSNYDRTAAPNAAGTVTFLDLPSTTGALNVTITGPAAVAVGTLMAGRLVGLGLTEASPTAGITDFSRKEVDDFGEVTVVQRAWAKRMNAKALIRTEALDAVASRIAAVRGQPSLWIGDAGLDSLTVYGFFKDFSIEVGATVSKLSLTIEGLSTAGKVEPLQAGVDWPDVGDPLGTKPQDNATNTALPTAPLGPTSTVGDELERLRISAKNALAAVLKGPVLQAYIDAQTKFADGKDVKTVIDEVKYEVSDGTSGLAQTLSLLGTGNEDGTVFIINALTTEIKPGKKLAQSIFTLEESSDGFDKSITRFDEILVDKTGTTLRSINVLDLNGVQVGTYNTLTQEFKSEYVVVSDVFKIISPNGGTPIQVFSSAPDGTITMLDVEVRKLRAQSVTIDGLAPGFSGAERFTAPDKPIGPAEETIIETGFFDVGMNDVFGHVLATIGFEHDGSLVKDTAATIRVYLDTGSGYSQFGPARRSGVRTNGGDTQYITSFAMNVAISSSTPSRIKVTGQGLSLGSGPTSGSVARGITIDTIRVGR